MEYYANAGKKVEIEANGKIYKRHVVKIDYVPVNTSINGLVENYIIPIYKKGDILYISKTLVSICTSQVLYRFDIHVSNLAKNITKNISLIRNANNIVNTYAMQVAIYLVGIIKAMYASLLASFSSNSFEAREKFIKYAGQPVTLIGGLISDSFPEYENFAILPPVGATEICAEIRKKYGITCFIGAMDDSTFNLIACSRDMKISAEELKNIIKDNPLGEKTTSTPLCIIRNAELEKEETIEDINKK